MHIVVYASAQEFLRASSAWLFEREALYNGLISASQLILDDTEIFKSPYWFAVAHESDQIVGCAIHAQPDGLMISDMPDAVTQPLAESLSQAVPNVRRIIGPPQPAKLLAMNCAAYSDRELRLENQWNVYRTDGPELPRDAAAGAMRLASKDDEYLVRDWGRQYGLETPAPIDVEAYFFRKLKERNLYLWDHNQPKCVAATSSRTMHGIKISAVFTPKNFRGRGYASSMVSELSRELLSSQCKFVTLSVIADDPAERMYKSLGFELIGTRDVYRLIGKSQ